MKNGLGQVVCIKYSGGTYQSQPWWMRVENVNVVLFGVIVEEEICNLAQELRVTWVHDIVRKKISSREWSFQTKAAFRSRSEYV